MKLRIKYVAVVLFFTVISAMFMAGLNGKYNGFLSMKNVEALADGETGLEMCYNVKGYCKNADGTIWTEFLNFHE